MFKDVDQIWKTTMDTIAKDPRVLTTAGTEGMLEEIKHGLHITITIDDGINKYVEDKKLIFPRFFNSTSLSNAHQCDLLMFLVNQS